jgi:hypothetical protein
MADITEILQRHRITLQSLLYSNDFRLSALAADLYAEMRRWETKAEVVKVGYDPNPSSTCLGSFTYTYIDEG